MTGIIMLPALPTLTENFTWYDHRFANVVAFYDGVVGAEATGVGSIFSGFGLRGIEAFSRSRGRGGGGKMRELELRFSK